MKRTLVLLCACAVLLPLGWSGDKSTELSHGLVGRYYQDPVCWNGAWPADRSTPTAPASKWTFTNYSYSRVEPLINHRFLKSAWFSIRWVGWLDTEPGHEGNGSQASSAKAPGSGPAAPVDEYVFEIHADDGCRLSIDGLSVIDDWNPRWEAAPESLRKSGPVRLAQGRHRIVVEYFQGLSLDKDDRDPMVLYWSSAGRGIPRQVIPAAHFWHSDEDMAGS